MSVAPPELSGFKFLRNIGSGGFSDVYLYQQHMPRRQVAVKVLRSAQLDARTMRAFQDEANTMARLADHRNIVTVQSADVTTDGRPYVIMAYYPPPDLSSRVQRNPINVPTALRMGIQLAGAVETAHRARILHRDIKPANILLDKSDAPILIDFGIAGNTQEVDLDEDLGVSLPWSPPEVLDGRSNGSVSSDIYSLGATLWHLLVGRAPFHVPGGDNTQKATLSRIFTTPAPATGIHDVPPSLERLLQQCLAKKPELRPGSALELAHALQGIERGLSLSRTEVDVLDLDDLDEDYDATSSSRQVGEPDTRPNPTLEIESIAVLPEPKSPPPAEHHAPPQLSEDESVLRTTRRPAVATDPAGVDHRVPQSPSEEQELHSPTVRRPPRTSSSPHPSSGTTAAAEASMPTTRRPQTPPVGAPEPATGRSNGNPKRWLASAVALVAALAIAGGVYLSNSGDPQLADTPSPTTQTMEPSPGDVVPGSPPPAPKIRVTPEAGFVTFRWKEMAGTRYQYQVQGDAASRPVTTIPLRVRATQAGPCIRVSAISETNGLESRSDWACP